jgi:cytochrome c oxidase subunit IV
MSPIVPKRTYVTIWLALMCLLFLTWGVARIHLGRWNLPVALTIALIKMLLVILFFMHVRKSGRLTWLFAAAGFIWLIIMIDLTMSDFLTRPMVPNTSADTLQLEKAPEPGEEKTHR